MEDVGARYKLNNQVDYGWNGRLTKPSMLHESKKSTYNIPIKVEIHWRKVRKLSGKGVGEMEGISWQR